MTNKDMPESKPLFIRSAALLGYRELAAEFGVDPNALLRTLRIDRRALDDPDQFISSRSFVELLELSSGLAKCPDFGLRLSQGRGFKVLGPVGLLALNEPDVGKALHTISSHLHLHNEGLRFKIDVMDELAQLSLAIDMDSLRSTRQTVELAVGVGVNLLRMLLGSDWNPIDVYFAHSAPLDTSLHRRIFQAPVYFKHEFSGFTFHAEDMNKPLRDADALTHKYLLSYINSLERQHGDNLVSKTRRVIFDLISSGRCGKTLIAGYMAMDPRTLQRKLKAQGCSFKQLTEDVRATLAAQYLSDSRKTLTEIAEVLGYSELSAFSRFFQRVYGKSPSEWRCEKNLAREHGTLEPRC